MRGMRRALALVALTAVCVLTVPAHADPLICVETGEVGVLDVWSYDPPDPCLL